jgi:hypothetical protein
MEVKFKKGDKVEILAPSKGTDEWTGRVLNVVGVPSRANGTAQDYALAWHPDGDTDVFIVEQRLRRRGFGHLSGCAFHSTGTDCSCGMD